MQHASSATEPTHIDAMGRLDALSAMAASHAAAVAVVDTALKEIDAAATLLAETISKGGVLHYGAAGSSGLMALADACELPGTFGLPQNQVRISMAGGVPADGEMPGETEDDTSDANAAAETVQPGDVAIVVSASGTTPFALAFARAARKKGARIISITNVADAPLLDLADVAIRLVTEKEVVDGSTRLGAGTAQKVALNMMSTQLGILLGHVHDGMMVNFRPENIKLRRRANAVVQQIANVDAERADQALQASGFDTKSAVLIAAGMAPETAKQAIAASAGNLRQCLQEYRQSETKLHEIKTKGETHEVHDT